MNYEETILEIIKDECEKAGVRKYANINQFEYSQYERNIAKRILELLPLTIPVINGNYYWVKCFKNSEYEPAKAKDRHGNSEMYFYFTNGSIKQCNNIFK